MPQLLYPWGKSPWYPLNKRLSGHSGKEEKIPSFPLPEIEP